MGRLGHFRDLGQADDLQDLGDVDAVIAHIGLAGRQRLLKIEFDDFQFVGAGFQKNVGLSHVPLAIRQPVVAGLRKRPVLETGLYDRTPPIDAS